MSQRKRKMVQQIQQMYEESLQDDSRVLVRQKEHVPEKGVQEEG